MVRRTPTRRPAGAYWPGASTASLASALACGSQRGMLRRGVRAAPPGSSQWQRCKCRAVSSPCPMNGGTGTPDLEDRAQLLPSDLMRSAAERLPACPPFSTTANSTLIQRARLVAWPAAGLSRAARAGARGGAVKALMAGWLPRPSPGAGGFLPRPG
jgi:hypothetical protein